MLQKAILHVGSDPTTVLHDPSFARRSPVLCYVRLEIPLHSYIVWQLTAFTFLTALTVVSLSVILLCCYFLYTVIYANGAGNGSICIPYAIVSFE